MVTKGLNKITQNETQALQLVDNFCKSWVNQLNCKNYDFERYDAMKRSGAGGGNRTHTLLRAADFESAASTNSATSAQNGTII